MSRQSTHVGLESLFSGVEFAVEFAISNRLN